jgi:hypothetical protein
MALFTPYPWRGPMSQLANEAGLTVTFGVVSQCSRRATPLRNLLRWGVVMECPTLEQNGRFRCLSSLFPPSGRPTSAVPEGPRFVVAVTSASSPCHNESLKWTSKPVLKPLQSRLRLHDSLQLNGRAPRKACGTPVSFTLKTWEHCWKFRHATRFKNDTLLVEDQVETPLKANILTNFFPYCFLTSFICPCYCYPSAPSSSFYVTLKQFPRPCSSVPLSLHFLHSFQPHPFPVTFICPCCLLWSQYYPQQWQVAFSGSVIGTG